MEALRGLEIYELIIFAVIGLLILFCGYRIKKIAFFLVWFILGYNLMMLFLPTLNQWVPQIAENNLWQILLPVGGGLLLGLLGFSIEKLCVGGICFALVMMVTVRYFGTEVQTLAIGGVVGVIAAAIAVMLMKPAIIVSTSLAGAYLLTLILMALVPSIEFSVFYWPIIIGLTAVGSLVQFSTTKDMS
ncbi:DUF4203 domain-containing protein [Candidatus Saccharibacteria bacterium]|nr:DUF4203 domain-containing protein [Candidatus Saccharibacteria bacterium]